VLLAQTQATKVICTWKGEWNFQIKEDELMISLTSFYFGPLSPMGYDFESSYEGFAEGFQKPFAKHAKQCFRELPSALYVVYSSVLTMFKRNKFAKHAL
jgi:hypothetical protein